jgi:protein gp37
MRDFLKSRYPEHFQRPNVWLGVTAENQEMADQRIPILLQTPAAKRFVSIEPCLSVVDLKPYLPHDFNREPHCPWCEDCIPRGDHGSDWWKEVREDRHGPFIDWCIVGGESGPGARPMHPDWARSLRNQCATAGVPFFFKGWGTKIMKKSDPGYMKIDGREHKERPEAT